MLSPPTWTISALPLTSSKLFESWRHNRIGGFTIVIYHQHRQIAEVPHPFRAFMLTGVVRVEMPPAASAAVGFPSFIAG